MWLTALDEAGTTYWSLPPSRRASIVMPSSARRSSETAELSKAMDLPTAVISAEDRAVTARTIDLDGDVGQVDGVPQNTIAVEDFGASSSGVPRSRRIRSTMEGLAVPGVDELGEALASLE